MRNLLIKIEALDNLQRHLETLGTELISHPDAPTGANEVVIAIAYTELKRVLRMPADTAPEAPAALFTLEEEKLGLPSHHSRAETAT